MIAPRRFLPSIASLLALEAVERLGTATAAAEELSLTHSAVSRQLKALEEQIDVPLLHRQGKGLALTAAGTTYARSVRDFLHDLARASLRVRAGGTRDTLTLAVPSSFGTHWLAARLRAFTLAHPEVLINLITRPATVDLGRDAADAAVHFGERDLPGMEFFWLAGERCIPCAAPDMALGADIVAARLLTVPLLHLDTRPGAWEEWFARHGVEAVRLRGMLFDQFTTMAEAAALGFGVALLPDYLAEPMIAAGRLQRAAADYVASEGSYWLVLPENRPVNAPLDRLVGFLAGESGGVTLAADPRPVPAP